MQKFYLFLTAICLGILTGLSVSPVIQTVLTSIFGIVITAISLWIGLDGENKQVGNIPKFNLNILPLFLFVLGITIGAIGGIYMRTHDVLGKPETEEKVDTNVSDKKNDTSKENAENGSKTGLFTSQQETCDVIQSSTKNQLIHQLRSIGDDYVNAVIDSCNSNPDLVKQKLSKLCK